jgi:hypothetical protein
MLRNYILNNYKDKPIEFVTSDLYQKYNLRSHVYENRIIFYTSKNYCNYSEFEPSIEANGIIFDEEWNLLCMPLFNYNNSVNFEELKTMVANYEYSVYSSNDSTIVNLYYDKDKWNIGTSKGISVNNIKFNNMTYMDMFKDTITSYFNNSVITEESLLLNDDEFLKLMDLEKSQNDKQKIFDDFWNKLDKDLTYTLGFRHPNIHKFASIHIQPYFVYFIQSYNRKTMKSTELNDINLPYQVKINIDLDEMVRNAKNAYENFIMKGKKPIFGYILRKNIKNILYNIPSVVKIHKMDQFKSMVLYNYLNHKMRPILLSLFSNFMEEINRIDIIINILVSNIINYNINSDNKFSKITDKFHSQLKDKVAINENNFNIIKDFIFNNENLEILYDIIYN